jgi:cytochrome P450 family 97 subfamily B polypeptide 3
MNAKGLPWWWNLVWKLDIMKMGEAGVSQTMAGTHGRTLWKVDMETFFCSVALDIIGLSVFNYEFGSVTNESPVIKAVYSALVESEHRIQTPAPYWNLPLANQLIPRLRKFNSDLKLLNQVLDKLIDRAKAPRTVEEIEELEKRNYNEVKDPSML